MSDIDEYFAFQTSSPHSLRQGPSPHQHKNSHDYNFSGIIYDETTDTAPSTDEEHHLPLTHDHELLRPASTRVSSVSSFPASVIHHTPVNEEPRTPSKIFFDYGQDRTTTPTYQPPRAHSTGFRHPSSVRAIQMRDEFDLSELENLTSRRRDSRSSFFSHRSSGSAPNSPVKRTSRSINSSPQKSSTRTKLRKEFPLVLLHCTLLPPALALRASHLSDGILEAIIPQPYNRRWKALQEKVVRNAEVKARGVLIPHPRDEYELLEEKLLESLDLERPRLRDGHFLAVQERSGAIDSGFESASSSDQAEEEHTIVQPDACPDCGKCVDRDTEAQRKWEIKVYAANGLLGSSAWSAAWQEMEKVDVEVSVWMPENVRREVDSRIEVLLEQEMAEKKLRRRERKQADDERLREIYGSDQPNPDNTNPDRAQDEIDGLFDGEQKDILDPVVQDHRTPRGVNATIPSQEPHPEGTDQPAAHSKKADVPLLDVLANYIRLLAQDRRNIAIFLLSVLVLFYGMNQSSTVPPIRIDGTNTPPVHDAQGITSQIAVPSTNAILSTDTSTITETTSVALSTPEEQHPTTLHILPGIVSSIVSNVQTAIPIPSILEKVTESVGYVLPDTVQDEISFLVDDATEMLQDENYSVEHDISDVLNRGTTSTTRDQEVCSPPFDILMTATEQGRCLANSAAQTYEFDLDIDQESR